MTAERPTESVQGIVVRIAAEPRPAPKGGYLFRGLELRGTPEQGRIIVMFPDFAGKDIHEFPLLCWEGAHVALYGLELNNRLPDGTVLYTVTPAGDLLLEPYRLVSVTEAVEAAGCLRAVDVRLRSGPDEPFWQAKGKLVHVLLDYLLSSDGRRGGVSFAEAYAAARRAFLTILPGSRVPVEERDFETDAATHFENLKSWLERNRDRYATAEVETDLQSPRWGLKGRADAILEGAGATTILELKSGKFMAEEHVTQLCAYSLLLEDHRPGRKAGGILFYSAVATDKEIAHCDRDMRSFILRGRNQVTALKRSFAFPGDPTPAEPSCSRTTRCFARPGCKTIFGEGPGRSEPSLRGSIREYYDRWFRLLSIEAWAQEGNTARLMNPGNLDERLESGATIRVSEVRGQAGDLLFPLPAPDASDEVPKAVNSHAAGDHGDQDSGSNRNALLELAFDGSSTDLSPGEEVIFHNGDPLGQSAFRGRIARTADGRVTAAFRLPHSGNGGEGAGLQAVFAGSPAWYLDKLPFSRGPEIARHALFRFVTQGHAEIVRCVVEADSQHAAEESRPVSYDPTFSEGLHLELNSDQEAAVSAALDDAGYRLIHGPPGTGKTRVLARLIKECLDRGERILVSSPTNVALDRLLMGLMDLGVRDFLRIGARSTVSREFREALDRAGETQALLDDLAAADLDFSAFRRRVADAALVGATAYQCAAHPIFQRRRFDRVIVDEAGQLDEPSTLGPLALAPKFVLGGDHLQLPPVVQCRSEDSDAKSEPGLEQSLFERLFRTASRSRISPLRVQYRMNEEVQAISSRLFYDGRLVPSAEAARRRLILAPRIAEDPDIGRIIDPDVPVVFVDVQGHSVGKARVEEAEVACRIVGSLMAGGVSPADMGVITPYRMQQTLIRNRLAESATDGSVLSVDTVDRFQGGEREVIILSLARSDGVTSFLADRKRLNVSLSRARSKLILLGHGEVLEAHPLFRDVLQGMERVTIAGPC